MKHLLRAALLVIAATTTIFAQNKLSRSATSGSYTYIYQLTDKEAFAIAATEKIKLNDAYLHTLVDSFYNVKISSYPRKLPYGNYLEVKAVKNQLTYRLLAQNNVNVTFINNRKDFQFTVMDLRGQQLQDVEVWLGKGKKVKFDQDAQLYKAAKGGRQPVITVFHNGVGNYFTYEKEKPYQPYRPVKKGNFFSRLFDPKIKSQWVYRPPAKPQKVIKPRYKGYMVFNKPKYKPLDTIKLKSYLLSAKGDAIKNKPLRLELLKGADKSGIVLGTIDPYRDGGYTHQFVLADSLQLQLDRNYILVLKEQVKKEWVEVLRGNFMYEDYELKSINFTVRSDKDQHSSGSPVSIFLKAVDENELTVPDGRVEVVLSSNYPSQFHAQQVFIKDTLWTTTLPLDPVGETKLLLPDSIFPKADLNFTAYFTFLNSNNEKQTAAKFLTYSIKSQEIKYEFVNDSLQLKYLVNGKPVSQNAMLYTSFPGSDEKDALAIALPATIKVNYSAGLYHIKTADGYSQYIHTGVLNAGININASQTRDSLQIRVNNPHKVPFWYTVFSDQKVLFKGYAIQLDTLLKHTGRIAHVKLNYLWSERDLSVETTVTYRPNALKVDLIGPEVVYPGQVVNMQVRVTDTDQRPVAGTDVTAYAYTSKFKNDYLPLIPSFGKQFSIRKLSGLLSAEQISLSGQMNLNWSKWASALNLDTVEYYKFTQTKDLYRTIEDGNDPKMAIVAPFVVLNGAILPVNIIYIDNVPVYFSQADQLQRYAFRVKPGLHHIRMRTDKYLVSLDDVELQKGKKTILSVAADVTNVKARVIAQPSTLTAVEAEDLSSYLIGINNNFSGDKSVIVADSIAYPLNITNQQSFTGSRYPQQSDQAGVRLLVGPFAQNYLNFQSGKLSQDFVKEPGYNYTFLPGLLKQTSYSGQYGFDTNLSVGKLVDDYKQQPLRKGEADSLWNEYLDLRSRTVSLFGNYYKYGTSYGRLSMELDTTVAQKMPYVKNILIFKYDEPDFLQIYPGQSGSFSALETGKYRILYLFKDNRYFVAEQVVMRSAGINYFKWKDVRINPADELSNKIDQHIKSVNIGKNSVTVFDAQLKILSHVSGLYIDPKKFTGLMRGKIIDGQNKLPVFKAIVTVKGTNYKMITDAEGRFEIKVPRRSKLVISYIGYETKEVDGVDGDAGTIELEKDSGVLEEIVVVGYGTMKKEQTLGAVSNFADIRIRGASTLNSDQKPMVILDGLPYSGDVDKLDPATILSMDVLKDAAATAIYGSRGVAGVIIIKTKTGNSTLSTAGELVQQEGRMRTNFSDYAIWEPKLFTNVDGKASFTVKFPDDITNWKTQLIAMNGRKQGGVGESYIRSFKMLSANFVSPLFALAGDSIKVIGKLMNYNLADETLNRTFSYNGNELLNGRLTFKNSKIDTVSIVARGGGFKMHADHVNVLDSLKFEYSLKQDNGYFDGEIRKIPLLPLGVTETKGFFSALHRDTTVVYHFDPSLGKVKLRAEASLFPTMLDEMEKIRNYEYLCNEQLASKLKALLLEKTVRKYLGEEFKEEKHIKEILKKLQNNRLPEGTWGWWQNSTEQLWISLHVVESLLQAQQQGYPVVLEKDKLYRYLISKLGGTQYFDQVYGIRLLTMLDDKYHINDWILAVEKKRAALEEKNRLEHKANSNVPLLAKQTLYEQLQLMQLRQKAGMPVDIDALLALKKETMFGNIYWGEPGFSFWDNSIQNTLLAYQVLKAEGRHTAELDKIHRYFLEQRKDGQWRNTYESSLILQTILPELMAAPGKKYAPAVLVLNQKETVTAFPFDKIVEPEDLTLNKKGDAPVYFTAYQQFNNVNPDKVSKDFAVNTVLKQNGVVVQKLKAGTTAKLIVKVDVRADADYVMIEIPIPAGCSYEQKPQNFWGVETHREYFKHKTSIFCTKLKKGSYTFDVQLMPRYSGNYNLNPAKAEMMYFPVFYGREGMKKVVVN